MPRMCAVCGKTYSKTIKRSHSMQGTITRLQPNLQWNKTSEGNRAKMCARCIRNKSKSARITAKK